MAISKGKWQEQLKAAEASGMSLAGYAAHHGIKVRSLQGYVGTGAVTKNRS